MKSCIGQDSSWLAFCLLACLMLVGCRDAQPSSTLPSASSPEMPVDPTTTGTVTVEVIEGDETKRYELTDIAAGTTVESIMRSLTEPEVTMSGSGITAFVQQIGDQSTRSNEGWVYRVDGEFATKGIGSTTVDPPVTITWSFGGME